MSQFLGSSEAEFKAENFKIEVLIFWGIVLQ